MVDNFGDAGVCWRLARQLSAERGHKVRLIIDRPDYVSRLGAPHALRRQLGQYQPQSEFAAGELFLLDGVAVFDWSKPPLTALQSLTSRPDVVIAAFQCELPADVRAQVDRPPSAQLPLWLNLDYLSAQTWVDSSHGLPSVKPSGAIEWFFLPGFTEASGGLIRERSAADCALPIELTACRADSLRVSLFCYGDQPLGWLAGERADLIVTAGCDQNEVRRQFGAPADAVVHDAGQTRLVFLPWLDQSQYDALLQVCDLNVVRGEDSWIRAIWAAQPFIWRPYPQSLGTDTQKLQAFLDRLLAEFDTADAAVVRELMLGVQSRRQPQAAWLEWRRRRVSIAEGHRRFSTGLSRQTDLATRLEVFVRAHML